MENLQVFPKNTGLRWAKGFKLHYLGNLLSGDNIQTSLLIRRFDPRKPLRNSYGKKETYEAFLKVLNPVTYSFSVFGWLGYEDSNEKEWRGDSSTYSAFPIPAVSSLGLIQWSVNIQAGRVDLSRTMGERLEGLREVVSFCSFRVSRLPWTRVRKK